MKLSDSTLKILKNYSQINNKFRFPIGNTITTVNEGGNMFSMCEVPEVFEVEAPFYDLNEFLSVVGLFEDPDLEFKDKFVRITEDGHSLDYHYGESTLVHQNKNGVKFPLPDFEMVVDKKLFDKIIKTSRILKLEHMKIRALNGIVDIELFDKEGENDNSYNIETEYTTTDEFEFIIKIESLVFISDTYNLHISSKGVTHWSGESGTQYYLRMEEDSKFVAGEAEEDEEAPFDED